MSTKWLMSRERLKLPTVTQSLGDRSETHVPGSSLLPEGRAPGYRCGDRGMRATWSLSRGVPVEEVEKLEATPAQPTEAPGRM